MKLKYEYDGQGKFTICDGHVRIGCVDLGTCTEDAEPYAALMVAAPELLEIAKAYRNLLRTAASTDGQVATFHHIESVLAKAEGKE